MDNAFYLNRLYPLQDQILAIITATDTGFYLTGGTVLSRGYLNHRYSDDLDLFVNDDDLFPVWADRIIQALSSSDSWINPPDPDPYIAQLNSLGQSLLFTE